jgi:hypothetical protein
MWSGRPIWLALLVATLVSAGLLTGCSKENKGLKITSIEPKTVPLEGGEVVIHGQGFQSDGTVGVTVYFGERKGKVVNIEGDDKMVVRAPGGSAAEKVSVKLIFDDSREFVYRDACTYAEVNKGYSVDTLTEGHKAVKDAKPSGSEKPPAGSEKASPPSGSEKPAAPGGEKAPAPGSP